MNLIELNEKGGTYLDCWAGGPAWSAAASSRACWTDLFLECGDTKHNNSVGSEENKRVRGVLRFPWVSLPPGLYSIGDVALYHLLVTLNLALLAFRTRLRCYSFRGRFGLRLTTAVGLPSLRSGVGHFGQA